MTNKPAERVYLWLFLPLLTVFLNACTVDLESGNSRHAPELITPNNTDQRLINLEQEPETWLTGGRGAGNSDNAVMTQVFIALCVYLILAFLKFIHGLTQSLQQMCRLIHLNLFARRDLIELFRPPSNQPLLSPQLSFLWNVK